MTRRPLLLLLLSFFACATAWQVGCTSDDPSSPGALDAGSRILDASSADATGSDAATLLDSSTLDSAVVDASVDASTADASTADASTVDASTVDASAVDASTVDASAVDASTVDASDAADAGPPSATCADATREGLSLSTYPGVAACAGTWTGHVSNASVLCGTGSHVCNGSEAALNAVAYADAIAVTGCFAMNAAQDSFVCHVDCNAAVDGGVDTAANVDMGAIGAACPYKFPGSGSCISGGRIDFSENSGTGCDFAAGLSGVLCCVD